MKKAEVLGWTKEIPTEAGWYWVRPNLEIFHFGETLDGLKAFATGDADPYDTEGWTSLAEFYGPIPEPGAALQAKPQEAPAVHVNLEDLRKVLETLCYETDPCRFDHHGYCQSHGWMSTEECYMAAANRILAALPNGREEDPIEKFDRHIALSRETQGVEALAPGVVEALQFYAAKSNWVVPFSDFGENEPSFAEADEGHRARNALAALQATPQEAPTGGTAIRSLLCRAALRGWRRGRRNQDPAQEEIADDLLLEAEAELRPTKGEPQEAPKDSPAREGEAP